MYRHAQSSYASPGLFVTELLATMAGVTATPDTKEIDAALARQLLLTAQALVDIGAIDSVERSIVIDAIENFERVLEIRGQLAEVLNGADLQGAEMNPHMTEGVLR